MKKIVITALITLIILWAIIFFIDYSRCSHLKEPLFVVAGLTADDGGSGIYYGLGYKVKMEKGVKSLKSYEKISAVFVNIPMIAAIVIMIITTLTSISAA